MVGRDVRLVGHGPPFLAPGITDDARYDTLPELRRARVVVLERDLPRARITLDERPRHELTDAAAARSSDDEELADGVLATLPIKPDERESRDGSGVGDKEAVPVVRLIAEPLQMADLEKAVSVGQRATRLGKVVDVELPQPVDDLVSSSVSGRRPTAPDASSVTCGR